MPDSSIISYKKLAYRRSSSGSQGLYLADDHLLIVDGSFKHKYRRLYLKDIQALLWCKSNSYVAIALILIPIVGILLVGSLTSLDDPILPWFYFCLNIPFMLMLVSHLYQRGTVYFGLVTSVQTVTLECISSLRKAKKIEKIITEAIETTQGSLSEQALQSYHQDKAKPVAPSFEQTAPKRTSAYDPFKPETQIPVTPPHTPAPPLPSQTPPQLNESSQEPEERSQKKEP